MNFFPCSDIKPGCQNVGVSFFKLYLVLELRIFLFILLGSQVSLPVEEWLLALTMQPGDIVELKVMSIAMARINLPTKRKMINKGNLANR